MPPSIKMFKKFFKKTSKNKDVKKESVECDSVPIQVNLPQPIPIPPEALSIPSRSSCHNPVPNNLSTGFHNNSPFPYSGSYHSASSASHSGQSSATPYIQLSVSNSHGFHIGDVQNVHVANGSVVNFNSPSSGLGSLEKSLSNFKTPGHNHYENLEKDYTKIKDWELSLISEYVGQDWKTLGQHLEIPEKDLLVIDKQWGNNPQEAASEMLNYYLKTFPDTSYGFVLHNLRETSQTKAVEQLIKLRS